MKKEEKIIVITGASSGIGYALATELAKDGNKVYACCRKESDLKKLSSITNIESVRLDITDPQQVHQAADHIKNADGHIDVLINNAGITGWGAIMDRDMDYIRKVMEVNFFGHVQITKTFYPLLKESKKNPVIINISSQAGNYALPFWSAYHSSKWALEAFSHCLRGELQAYGIRVAIIQPGAIKSEAFEKDRDDFQEYKSKIDTSDFVKYAIPSLDASFNRPPVSTEKSPLLVVNAVRKIVYGSKNKVYYQPGKRIIPDLLVSILPYSLVDKIYKKLMGL